MIKVCQAESLFHMQLDEDANLSQEAAVRADEAWIKAISGSDISKTVAVGVLQVQGLVPVDGSGEQARTQASHAKAGAFFFREDHDGHGSGAHKIA
ncbi:hypothetical protein D3C73_1489300 [compost metagenome]